MNNYNLSIIKKHLKTYSRDMTGARFANYGKRKFNKNLYYDDIESAYLAGILVTVDEVHKENLKNPYESADEMMGDLQTLMVNLFNDYRAKNLMKNSEKMTIENLVKGSD